MIINSDSQYSMKENFYLKLAEERNKLVHPDKKLIKMDVHCHDRNSDSPDELWGRILGLRETWIETDELTKILLKNGAHALTITNHNNATSCWSLLEKGIDVLPAAEFTCQFRE
jgi:predicted metal-dependent phosphoesterase TrpH